MIDNNNKDAQGNVIDESKNEGVNQDGSGNSDTEVKLSPEVLELIEKAAAEKAKAETKGRDRQIGELTNKLKSLEAKEEAERLKNLDDAGRLKEFQSKVESYEKIERFRDLCSEHGVDASKYKSSAMNLKIDELDNFVTGIKQTMETVKAEAELAFKKSLQEKASLNQPSGENNKNIDEDDEFFKNYKESRGL